MKVPFLDLKAQQRQVRAEILESWEALLDDAGFIGGEHVAAFEHEFAEAHGAAHGVAVSNGTAALQMILEALGIKPGDEVLVPVNTFIATSEAVSKAGGVPVFVDVDPTTYTMDVRHARAALTPRTVGIIPVHLYGQPADMDALLKLASDTGLWIVEDAAQAHLAQYGGRTIGTFGRAAGFSFYPGKNLGACGDAGAILTNDGDLATRLKKLREHGSSVKYVHEFEGYNHRCDAIQAAALRVKLKRLPEWNESRRKVATLYRRYLQDVPEVVLPAVTPNRLPVWHLFVVLVDRRDDVRHRLQQRGIATGLHYPIPLHRQQAYAHRGYGEGSFPVAESLAQRLVSLPMYPELTEEQIAYVCTELKEAVRATSAS